MFVATGGGFVHSTPVLTKKKLLKNPIYSSIFELVINNIFLSVNYLFAKFLP